MLVVERDEGLVLHDEDAADQPFTFAEEHVSPARLPMIGLVA